MEIYTVLNPPENNVIPLVESTLFPGNFNEITLNQHWYWHFCPVECFLALSIVQSCPCGLVYHVIITLYRVFMSWRWCVDVSVLLLLHFPLERFPSLFKHSKVWKTDILPSHLASSVRFDDVNPDALTSSPRLRTEPMVWKWWVLALRTIFPIYIPVTLFFLFWC